LKDLTEFPNTTVEHKALKDLKRLTIVKLKKLNLGQPFVRFDIKMFTQEA